MATRSARSASKTVKSEASAAPVLRVNLAAPAAVKALKRETARSRTINLAKDFEGKPLAAFEKAWVEKALEIHGPNSVFTSREKAQAFSGWLSWLKRNEIVTVK